MNSWPLKKGPIDCLETSVCNNPEEGSSYLLPDGSFFSLTNVITKRLNMHSQYPAIDFELKWSEMKWVRYVEVLGDKITMHIRLTLYWGYLILLWLFYLVCILYCGCFNLFFVMRVCVCVLVICVLVFTVFCVVWTVFFLLFGLCVFILICFVCTSVRTTAIEWQLNCS